MSAPPREVAIGLGSNIGDKAGHVRDAAAALEADGILEGITLSRLYRTAPWGHVQDQDWFVNACAVGLSTLEPHAILHGCKAIEARLGRTVTVRWGPRVIDLDILYVDDLAVETPDLVVPHRELMRRSFVLVPLAEIRPHRMIGGVTIAEAARRLGDGGIVPLAEDGSAVRVIRTAALPATPWKNQGGTTVEILAHPAGAALADFDWRISMADVRTDGPFSLFPGVDRTLFLLDGAEFELSVGGEPHRLDQANPLLGFPGDVPVESRLTAGPVRDINVMTRRGAFSHAVHVVGPGLVEPSDLLVLVALDQGEVQVAGERHTLARGDAVVSRGALHGIVTLSAPCLAIGLLAAGSS